MLPIFTYFFTAMQMGPKGKFDLKHLKTNLIQ